MIGLRHLFTICLKEPLYAPEKSPLFNRKSDYCMEANEVIKPFVLIFFAVPSQGLKINFQFNLHLDDMVKTPNDVLGLHLFSLRYHDVIWFAYRTKHMEVWPEKSIIVYHDGFTFPVFIGTGSEKFRLEFRAPQYSMSDKELSILCNQDYPDSYSNP